MPDIHFEVRLRLAPAPHGINNLFRDASARACASTTSHGVARTVTDGTPATSSPTFTMADEAGCAALTGVARGKVALVGGAEMFDDAGHAALIGVARAKRHWQREPRYSKKLAVQH